ncbi:MAG: DUF4959 domain-containing protein [Tannerella sp.]|jgi:hypothetical protein|nr:DUF4959 domain-containing protein [Tannerella sp.]
MKSYLFKIFVAAALLYMSVISGCKEEERVYYLDDSAGTPQQVTDVKVLPTPGGAIITYKLPKDKSLSYVKAVYEIEGGIVREAKSSIYSDTLKLEGFGDTRQHTVNIYSVSRNEKMSEPLPVSVTPLEPPVFSVFKTLTMEATFGGLDIRFQNETQASLAIFIQGDTVGGEWFNVADYYSAAPVGNISIRGMNPTEGNYSIYLRDRWNNKSDTMVLRLTPLYEELIPYGKFKLLNLVGDKSLGQPKYPVMNIFNGKYGAAEDWYKSEDDTYPQWFTIDIGNSVIFSRMKLFQAVQYPYVADWVKDFEIWGSNEPVADWDKWTLLGSFQCEKPSGLPDPQYTAEDMDYERAGEDYNFPTGIPAVRYFRFKVLINRGGGGKFYVLNEVLLWGQIIKEN